MGGNNGDLIVIREIGGVGIDGHGVIGPGGRMGDDEVDPPLVAAICLDSQEVGVGGEVGFRKIGGVERDYVAGGVSDCSGIEGVCIQGDTQQFIPVAAPGGNGDGLCAIGFCGDAKYIAGEDG